MASRRMFNTGVVNSDDFLEVSNGARLLYFAMIGKADDDGFVDCVKGLCRSWGLQQSDLDELIDSGYIMDFGSVVLIVHWNLHNKVPKDRYHPTLHTELAGQVVLNDKKIYERISGFKKTTFSSDLSLYTQEKKEENKINQDNIASGASAPATNDGAGKIFLAAMKMLQIRHTFLLHNQRVDPDDFDKRPLPVKVIVTPQLTQMRRQLEAVSKRLFSGEGTVHDRVLYQKLFGSLFLAASG